MPKKTYQIQEKPAVTHAKIMEAVAQNARAYSHYEGVDWTKAGASQLPPTGVPVAANAGLFVQSFFDRPLTDYAQTFVDPSPLDAHLEAIAPQVMVPRRFTYKTWTHIEEFYIDLTDDLRPLRGDFKTVERTGDEVHSQTQNHGLRLVVDMDEEEETPDWQEVKVAWLMRRCKRNALVRAFNLISAASTNNAQTWDSTADPDYNVMALKIAATTATGIGLNKGIYGDTSWATRFQSLRGNANAAKFGTAGMTEQMLGDLLGLDITVMRERYASSMTALKEMVGNLVLIYFAQSQQSLQDASNVKRFVSNCKTGGKWAVYVRQITAKLWEIVVEYYEDTTITSTIGMEQITTTA